MSTALASIQEKIKAQLVVARSTVATPTARTISTKGKVFTLPTGQSSQGPLSAIILDWRNFNKYYTAAYNPAKPSPPDCFAIHSVITEMAPHEKAVKPSSDDCASCTFNKFGSAATGRGKACRNTVRLAIVPADFTADSDPMLLNISPTGIRPWSSYVNTLLVNDLMPINMISEITFDANAAYPTLLFKAIKTVDDLEMAWLIREKAQAMLDAPPATDGD
jgi:hypothetical protein